MSQPTTVYLTVVGQSGATSVSANLTSSSASTPNFATAGPLVLSQLGSTGVWMAPFTAVPTGFTGAVPSDAPAISIPLGGGQLVATPSGGAAGQTAYATSSTLFPSVLRLRFLTRDGTSLTPSPDGNPANIGLQQQTEIGDSTANYPEIVQLQVAAENPYGPLLPLDPINIQLGITELPNQSFYPTYAYFYDGTNGGTLLDGSGEIGGVADGNFVTLSNGRAVVQLASGAGVRSDKYGRTLINPSSQGQNNPSNAWYANQYAADLRVVIPNSTQTSGVEPQVGPDLQVAQWVDERTYDRMPLKSSLSWDATSSGNGIRDWLEKKVWDYWTNYYLNNTSNDTEMATALSMVQSISESTEGPIAEVNGSKQDPTQNGIVVWNVAAAGLRIPLFGISGLDGGYFIGHFDLQHEVFKHAILHEPRHCWQYNLSTPAGDFLLTNPPPSANVLWDSPYKAVGGENPDFWFLGPSVIDHDVTTALERDAVQFAASRADNPVTCAVDLPPTDMTPVCSGPDSVPLAVMITFAGQSRVMMATPVLWTIVAAAATNAVLSPCASTSCWTATDINGIATASLVGDTPGLYQVTAAIGPSYDPFYPFVGSTNPLYPCGSTYIGNSVATFNVTLLGPLTPTSLTLSPTSVAAGDSSVGTVTLSGPAPTGGVAVTLTSSDTQSANVPASGVTVPAGSTSATFTVTTLASAPSSSVTISAQCGNATTTATLTLVTN